MQRALLSSLICFLPAATPADTLRDGYFRIITDGATGTLEISGGQASIGISSRGCAGSMSGPLERAGYASARFSSSIPGGGSCTITVDILPDGTPGEIHAGRGCSYFHGATCSFSGFTAGPEVPFSIEAIDAGFNALPRELRMQAQRVLQAEGLYRSGIDGITGPGTRTAIIESARQIVADGGSLDLRTPEAVRRFLTLMVAAPLLTEAAPPPSAPGPRAMALAAPVTPPADGSVATAAPPAPGDIVLPPVEIEVTAPLPSVESPAAEPEEEPAPGIAWQGNWICASDTFGEPARFIFSDSQVTLENFGMSMRHTAVEEIGGRPDALRMRLMDGEELGMFHVRQDGMVLVASGGVFDCRRPDPGR